MQPSAPQTVQFLVTDLIHPHPARVLLEMFRHHRLEGEVAARTTDGQRAYVVVRVPGMAEPVIVPLDRTQPVGPAACASQEGV